MTEEYGSLYTRLPPKQSPQQSVLRHRIKKKKEINFN